MAVIQISRELASLVPRFLGNCTRYVADLRAAIAQSDLDGTRQIGHSLRGVGGGYGFAEITRLGAEIESASLAGNLAAVSTAVDELADYLAAVQVEYV